MVARSVLRVVSLHLLSFVAAAQGPQIAWEADFDAALKAAKADGKPIFIAFIMDGDSANDEVAQSHFHDPEIVAASKEFHCLIASLGSHSDVDSAPCSRFGAVPCSVHVKTNTRATEAYLQSHEVSAPQFLFIKPDGETMLLRSVWLISAQQLLKKMRLALGFNDPSKVNDEMKKLADDAARLIAQADDKNANTRADALRSLSSLDDPRIMAFLIKQTAETVDEPRRLEAVNAMGSKGNAKALPCLLKLLSTKSAQLRNHVVIAIEKLAMAEAGPALYLALKRESKDKVRANIVRALAVCDPKTADHVKAIVAMIGAGSQIERTSAIRASFDVPMDPAVKKALLLAAKDNTAQIRGMAYYALARAKIAEAETLIEKAVATEKVMEVKQLAQSSLAILKGTRYDGPNGSELIKAFLVDDYLRTE